MTSVELAAAPFGLVELWRGLALRARVRVSRARLDEQLAAGADPAAQAELAVRAAQLVRPRYRRRLASCAEKLVADYDADRGWWLSAAIPFLHDQVGEARVTLLTVAAVLRGVDRVEPRGVALFEKLLTDTNSPLYVRTANGALQLKTRAALEYLVGDADAGLASPSVEGGSSVD